MVTDRKRRIAQPAISTDTEEPSRTHLDSPNPKCIENVLITGPFLSSVEWVLYPTPTYINSHRKVTPHQQILLRKPPHAFSSSNSGLTGLARMLLLFLNPGLVWHRYNIYHAFGHHVCNICPHFPPGRCRLPKLVLSIR